MPISFELKLAPDVFDNDEHILQSAATKLGVSPGEISSLVKRKLSLDARSKYPFYVLQLDAYLGEEAYQEVRLAESFQQVGEMPEVIIVGAGPAGYFAAIECLIQGIKPIVLERGKDVQARRRDLKAIQQDGIVNPHSNYCFGEGGAGTYSDGKLYTRSKKRGELEKVLRLLVEHGAKPGILYEAHPHIGSNKLPNVVANIRQAIIDHGGEVHFNANVTGLALNGGQIKGVVLEGGLSIKGEAVVISTGHSARDIFYLFQQNKLIVEAKPFALGLRAEHPQTLIDTIQYGQGGRANHNLPASSYSLACQVDNRGVFSFCMCPGGLIVPASTSPGEIVVNGMSMSRRDSPYANSGVVVAVEHEDLADFAKFNEMKAVKFQESVEKAMFNFGDGSQKAPAQRLGDFISGKNSQSLNGTSYIPGLVNAPLHELLPKGISKRLREGLKEFGKKMKGYDTNEANVVGVESRTSSPIKIPRLNDSFMHPQCDGLFPCGEGAGYAGGIVSAAMDGVNVASAIKKYILSKRMV